MQWRKAHCVIGPLGDRTWRALLCDYWPAVRTAILTLLARGALLQCGAAHCEHTGPCGLALAAGIAAAAAQEMKARAFRHPRSTGTRSPPSLSAIDGRSQRLLRPARTGDGAPMTRAGTDLARLNRATGERFADIAASPVPVLLPFDTAAFLRDRARGADSQ